MIEREGANIKDLRKLNQKIKSIDWNNVKKDPSVMALIFSNLMTLVFALIFNWNIFIVFLIYVAQSLIIGFFTFIKILTLSNYSAEEILINGKKTRVSFGIKIFTAIFFVFHYGLFQLVYLFFIMNFMAFFSFGTNPVVLPESALLFEFVFPILISILLFFISHGISFLLFRNKKQESLEKVMVSPYYRIIPMHLTLMFGFFLLIISPMLMLVLFLIIKTVVDVGSHAFEHKDQY